MNLYKVLWAKSGHIVVDYVVAKSLSMASITYKLQAPSINNPHCIEKIGFTDTTIYVEEQDSGT